MTQPKTVESVHVYTIPHDNQRYDTIGDWVFARDGRLAIYTSRLPDWRASMACAVHEIVEALLCVQDGIPEEDVSLFDIQYEAARAAGTASLCGCTPTADSEPGEDTHAPYRSQHAFADGIERLLADRLGLPWAEYSEQVAALEWRASPEHGRVDPS